MATLHISANDFWNTTPSELYYALKAYSTSKIDDVKMQWEQMRTQTFYLIDIQIDKKYKMSYEKFKRQYMPFNWDEKSEQIIDTPDWGNVEQKISSLSEKATTTLYDMNSNLMV